MTGNTVVRAMACLSCLQCYEQTASSEETWGRHFTHTSWLSAWGGNTPAQFTVTPFAGKALHSVFGLFQFAAGGPAHGRAVNADQYCATLKGLREAIKTKRPVFLPTV
jgi:hypothetical protein